MEIISSFIFNAYNLISDGHSQMLPNVFVYGFVANFSWSVFASDEPFMAKIRSGKSATAELYKFFRLVKYTNCRIISLS